MRLATNRDTLLILSPGFAASETDINCLPAQQSLIHALNKAYPHIQIILLAFEYPHTREKYTWFGNTVIPFGGRNKGGIARMLRWIRVWGSLSRLKREHHVYGILSFWLGQCSLLGYYFGRLHHIKNVSWLLGQDARKENRYAKLMPLQAASLVAISDELSKLFEKNYAVKPAHVIPTGIDPDVYSSLPQNRNIDIIGVGSLIPLKQYDLFIEVIRSLHAVLPGLHVLISGEGPEKERLDELIQTYGLQDTIKLTGELPHNEVLQLMQKSRILLHTSSYEGFSGACLEALYAGAHVISFQQPMDAWIRHWHIAENKEDMVKRIKDILQSGSVSYTPSLPYRMTDTAEKFMQLFID